VSIFPAGHFILEESAFMRHIVNLAAFVQRAAFDGLYWSEHRRARLRPNTEFITHYTGDWILRFL